MSFLTVTISISSLWSITKQSRSSSFSLVISFIRFSFSDEIIKWKSDSPLTLLNLYCALAFTGPENSQVGPWPLLLFLSPNAFFYRVSLSFVISVSLERISCLHYISLLSIFIFCLMSSSRSLITFSISSFDFCSANLNFFSRSDFWLSKF